MPGTHEDIAKAEDGFDKIRLHGEGAALRFAGGGKLGMFELRQAEVVKKGGLGRHDRERSAQDTQRAVALLEIVFEHAEQVERVTQARIQDQSATIEPGSSRQVRADVLADGFRKERR